MSHPPAAEPDAWIQPDRAGVRLSVRVTPRSARNGVRGVETDPAGRAHLRIRLAAPPADGKANTELVRFLAKRWRMANTTLSLISGASARQKMIHIAGEPEMLLARITAIECRD